MQDSFLDLFTGIASLESVEFLQLDAHHAPVINIAKWKNEEVPRTEVPTNPCNDECGGAPSPVHDEKRANKCTISRSPQCYKLQERFLLIHSGIEDSENALLEDIASMLAHCKETRHHMASTSQQQQPRRRSRVWRPEVTRALEMRKPFMPGLIS